MHVFLSIRVHMMMTTKEGSRQLGQLAMHAIMYVVCMHIQLELHGFSLY